MKNKIFRFWDKNKEEWYSGDINNVAKLHYLYNDEPFYEINSNLICQEYTGVIINGKTLFEGDIVQVDSGEFGDFIGRIVFEYGNFMISSIILTPVNGYNISINTKIKKIITHQFNLEPVKDYLVNWRGKWDLDYYKNYETRK